MNVDRTLVLIVLFVAASVAVSALVTYNMGSSWNDVTYDANGGSTQDGKDVIHSGDILAGECPFQREGYVFVEWNTEKDGTGKTYMPGDSLMWDVPITLYAQWTQV